MALVTRSTKASLEPNSAITAHRLSGDLFAGEDVEIGPARIAADGYVYNSTGAAADANAKFDGFITLSAKAGQPVSLFGLGAVIKYSDGGLTPGQDLYIAGTKGRLDSAATTGDAVGVARAIDTNNIRVTRAK